MSQLLPISRVWKKYEWFFVVSKFGRCEREKHNNNYTLEINAEINMEPENHMFEKENPSSNTSIFGFRVNFHGCTNKHL